jgi:hypothetical protein
MSDLRFKIDAFQPDTIPMARLAEYMSELATLLGHEKAVHFVRLDRGSVALVHRVDIEERPQVDARLQALRQGVAPADVIKAYRRIDDMLASDDATGELSDEQVNVVVPFLGRTRPKPAEFKAFSEQGSLDGIPVRVGGIEEIVPIHLQESGVNPKIHICQARRELARAIATHLFTTPIRVYGMGRWRREASGEWHLVSFVANDFEVLDDTPLDAVVARLRGIPGNKWHEDTHALTALRKLRDEADQPH